MRARLLTLGILLLAACSSGEDGPTGTGSNSEVSLVGGQVVCDSCASARFVLAGRGIAGVRSATLISSDLKSTTLPARVSLDRVSDPAGDQLVVTIYFDQGVPEGEFDLWLDPPTVGDAARIVPAALRVTRALPGPGTLGTVRVYVQVSGVDRDFAYTVRAVAGCEPADCPPIAVEAFTGASQSLLPGTYTFRLDDVGENCTIAGSPNPATLELQRGISTALSYRLTCVQVANPGWVRVSNVTTGPELDRNPDYQVSCRGLDCRAFTLAANRDTVLRLAPGEVTIGFTGVAAHCSLASPTTVALTVSAGDTATAAFPVTCRERPSINVTIRTSGREIVDSVNVYICSSDYYSNFGCRGQTASSNGTVMFAGIDAGAYSVQLDTYSLPENCAPTGGSSRGVQVQGSAVFVELAITCQAFGTVRVSTVTSGTNQDASYEVVRLTRCNNFYYYDSCDRQLIASSGSVDFRAASGPQTFMLTDVASNCTVTAANPATVTAIEDAIVDLRFEVACQ